MSDELRSDDDIRHDEEQALFRRHVRVWTAREACAPDSPFEYDQGEVVLTHYDDLYDMLKRHHDGIQYELMMLAQSLKSRRHNCEQMHALGNQCSCELLSELIAEVEDRRRYFVNTT